MSRAALLLALCALCIHRVAGETGEQCAAVGS